jgi:hypothetical protein
VRRGGSASRNMQRNWLLVSKVALHITSLLS